MKVQFVDQNLTTLAEAEIGKLPKRGETVEILGKRYVIKENVLTVTDGGTVRKLILIPWQPMPSPSVGLAEFGQPS